MEGRSSPSAPPSASHKRRASHPQHHLSPPATSVPSILTNGNEQSPIPNPLSLTTPSSKQPYSSPSRAAARGRKRNFSVSIGRSSAGAPGELDPSSAGAGYSSGGSDDDEDGKKRHNPGVKRACNQCRQQKLRCDVSQDPWQPCTRCIKHHLECRIDTNFKRVGKRSRFVELERENSFLERRIAELEKQLRRPSSGHTNGSRSAGPASPAPPDTTPHSQAMSMNSAMYSGLRTNDSNYVGSHEAVASLLDLKQGLEGTPNPGSSSGGSRLQLRSLEDVVLAPDRVRELFSEFFVNYHEFMPLLDESKSPDFYYEKSPLLFWTVIIIAARHFGPDRGLLARLTNPYTHLVWSTMSNVPQNYHVVKALCLLCTWPLPTSSTSSDPTFMFSGLMMKIAKQVGLHRPANAQDFSKTRICLRDEDVNDMLMTWACCNIVAQNISTGYGQPPEVVYDTALDFGGRPLESHPLPLAVAQRLELEKLCNRITLNLYTYATESNVLWDGIDEPIKVNMFGQALLGFENRVTDPAKWLPLHIRAVDLHLRLHTLVDPPNSPTYLADLSQLYKSTIAFLDTALEDEGRGLKYASWYIMQMMLAAGFSLMRLLNSFFARTGRGRCGGGHTPVDCDIGRNRFYSTVHAIRNLSVIPNDLPQRLAEVLVQLWKAYGGGLQVPEPDRVGSAVWLGLQGRTASGGGVGPGAGSSSASGDAEMKGTTVSPLATMIDPAASGGLPAGMGAPTGTATMHPGATGTNPGPGPGPGCSAECSPGRDINSLQLGVRNRMSMSLLYDSVWRWREEIQGKIRAENLDTAVQNPTSPEVNAQVGTAASAGGAGAGISPLNVGLQTPVVGGVSAAAAGGVAHPLDGAPGVGGVLGPIGGGPHRTGSFDSSAPFSNAAMASGMLGTPSLAAAPGASSSSSSSSTAVPNVSGRMAGGGYAHPLSGVDAGGVSDTVPGGLGLSVLSPGVGAGLGVGVGVTVGGVNGSVPPHLLSRASPHLPPHHQHQHHAQLHHNQNHNHNHHHGGQHQHQHQHHHQQHGGQHLHPSSGGYDHPQSRQHSHHQLHPSNSHSSHQSHTPSNHHHHTGAGAGANPGPSPGPPAAPAPPLTPVFPTPLTSIDMFDPLSWFLNETASDSLFHPAGMNGPGGSSAGPSSVTGFGLR